MTADPLATTPASRQRAALAELDRRQLAGHAVVEHLLDGGSNGLETDFPYTAAHVYWFTWAPSRTDAVIVALRDILERHAPVRPDPYGPYGTLVQLAPPGWICRRCKVDCEDCPDWRSAIAAVEATE